MFYQLPHVPVSLIPYIDPLPDLFPKESLTSLSKSPPSITVGPSDSHALRRSHRVTTLPSHLRDFHCFSALASL